MGEELNVKYEEMKTKDDEPAPKRQSLRVLEARNRREDIRAPSYWDRLPYHLTVQVYSYLKESDRKAMARVCRAWYKSFKDPSLWRSREFTLGGPYATQTGKNEIRFASMFGSGLQHVVICCQHRTSNTCKHITETMEKLLGKLENARLCRLVLFDLELERFLEYPDLRDTVGSCLVKMIKTQTALKNVVFCNCQFEYLNGTEILNALWESSGQTLESLHLNNFYQRLVDVFKANTYLDIVTKFTNLKYISINYSYISDEILQRWTVHLKGKLQLIKIRVWESEPHGHVITSRTWMHLITACPQLQVDLFIYDLSHADHIIPLMPPGMPLTGFSLKSDMESAYDNLLDSTLTHLADNFDKKLEILNLIFPFLRDSVDNEIIRIVEKCSELIAINIKASPAFGVCRAWYKSFKDPSLWRSREFTLGGPYTSPTDRKVIRFASMFGSSLQDVVISCDHRTTNRCKRITATMEKLLGNLENARLCRLEILDLQLRRFLPFPDLRKTVCGCLVKMLKTQTTLKHVLFENCQFDFLNGTEVLNALLESSGQTLESLHVNNFLWGLVVVKENAYLAFKTMLQKFTNLREISVNYRYISDEMLQRWTVDLKAKLQLIKINVIGSEPHGHVITSRTWTHLSTACPQLQVDLSINFVSHTTYANRIITLLPPGMPLTSFYMKSDIKRADDNQLASALTHLADNFNEKLKSLTLIFPNLKDSVDNEIVRIVEMCHELTIMRFPASAAFGVATAIRNAFREKNVRLQIGLTERFGDNSQQDVVRRFLQEMLSNIPNTTVEFVN